MRSAAARLDDMGCCSRYATACSTVNLRVRCTSHTLLRAREYSFSKLSFDEDASVIGRLFGRPMHERQEKISIVLY